MSKYYAIAKGREVGIFRDWNTTKEFVNGYPNSKFKSFLSLEEANDYLLSFGINNKIIKDTTSMKGDVPPIQSSPLPFLSASISKEIHIYTDGSHTKERGGVGI